MADGVSDRELVRAIYLQMATIRRVEETLLDLFRQGHARGTAHTSIGQEACAAGVVGALDRERDFVFSNHRCHGHFLAWGGSPRALFAEILGRTTGVCGGLGGSQHLCWNGFYSNGIQGGIVPVSVGLALARRAEGRGGMGAVFVGDGTFGEGALYESMNLAALWGAPLLFVVEDNGYAQSTPSHLQHAGRLAARPAAFGLDTVEHTVENPVALRRLAQALAQAVRADERPRCLWLHTYRLAPHSLGEDLRDPEELAARWAADPLPRLRRRLGRDEADAIDAEVAEAIARALAQAEGDPRAGTAPFAQTRRMPESNGHASGLRGGAQEMTRLQEGTHGAALSPMPTVAGTPDGGDGRPAAGRLRAAHPHRSAARSSADGRR